MNDQPITKQNLELNGKTKAYEITEVFETIQGEGPLVGMKALFVRLAGCNLQCFYCDTQYDTQYHMHVDDIVRKFKKFSEENGRLIVITGGEPFRQDIGPLVEALYNEGAIVQLETNGTLSIENFPWTKAIIVCSPKTGKIHPDIEKHATGFRYTLREGEVDFNDGLPVYSTQIENKQNIIYRAPHGIFVSPCDDGDPALNKENRNLAVDIVQKFGYRLSLQIHKILELP